MFSQNLIIPVIRSKSQMLYRISQVWGAEMATDLSWDSELTLGQVNLNSERNNCFGKGARSSKQLRAWELHFSTNLRISRAKKTFLLSLASYYFLGR